MHYILSSIFTKFSNKGYPTKKTAIKYRVCWEPIMVLRAIPLKTYRGVLGSKDPKNLGGVVLLNRQKSGGGGGGVSRLYRSRGW